MAMTARVLQVMPGGRIPLGLPRVSELELTELLGVGGYGSVWKGVDTATGEPYVLKIIQNIRPGTVSEARVRLEAEVSIPSDYIVPVVGLCQWDCNTYLILFEFFPGKSLEDELESGDLTGKAKKRIFEQTLLGVADAHRNNVIHRDLKPGNILVCSDGRTRLIDFGISKFKDRAITLTGDWMGTPPYMAPELLRRGAKLADARVDIYALGQILYELAMGEHFWKRQGWSQLDDLLGFLTRDPPPREVLNLDDFSCDFYPDVGPTISRMVRINPDERYASVDELLSELGYIPYLSPVPADLHLRFPILIVESGNNRGARLVLGLEDGVSRQMGRADFAGADTSITRGTHLEFSRAGEDYFVRDLGSTNGTLVRGTSLPANGTPVLVRHADRIKVGDVFLRFVFLADL